VSPSHIIRRGGGGGPSLKGLMLLPGLLRRQELARLMKKKLGRKIKDPVKNPMGGYLRRYAHGMTSRGRMRLRLIYVCD
jgi:hypothetical protein